MADAAAAAAAGRLRRPYYTAILLLLRLLLAYNGLSSLREVRRTDKKGKRRGQHPALGRITRVAGSFGGRGEPAQAWEKGPS